MTIIFSAVVRFIYLHSMLPPHLSPAKACGDVDMIEVQVTAQMLGEAPHGAVTDWAMEWLRANPSVNVFKFKLHPSVSLMCLR